MNRRAFLSGLALLFAAAIGWVSYDIGHSHGERAGIRWARLHAFGSTVCSYSGEVWKELGTVCHTARAERR